jgi:glutaredoxin
MRQLSVTAFILLALAVTTADAQLYRWVDKDGKVSYSDTPPPKDAKDVRQKSFSDNVTVLTDDVPYSIRVAMEKNPVTLFANACGEPCANARTLLSSRGIPFTDKNPDKDSTAMEALKQATGGQSVPALKVGSKVLKGYSEDEWNSALTSAGYPRNNPNLRPRTPAPTPPAPPTPAPGAAPGTATPAPTPAK